MGITGACYAQSVGERYCPLLRVTHSCSSATDFMVEYGSSELSVVDVFYRNTHHSQSVKLSAASNFAVLCFQGTRLSCNLLMFLIPSLQSFSLVYNFLKHFLFISLPDHRTLYSLCLQKMSVRRLDGKSIIP